jgi:hypothetical protein
MIEFQVRSQALVIMLSPVSWAQRSVTDDASGLGPEDPQEMWRGAGSGLTLTAATEEATAINAVQKRAKVMMWIRDEKT